MHDSEFIPTDDEVQLILALRAIGEMQAYDDAPWLADPSKDENRRTLLERTSHLRLRYADQCLQASRSIRVLRLFPAMTVERRITMASPYRIEATGIIFPNVVVNAHASDVGDIAEVILHVNADCWFLLNRTFQEPQTLTKFLEQLENRKANEAKRRLISSIDVTLNRSQTSWRHRRQNPNEEQRALLVGLRERLIADQRTTWGDLIDYVLPTFVNAA